MNELDELRRQLAASEASRARLLAAAKEGSAWMYYTLEFWDWRNFPSLEEEVAKKREQILAAIAAEPTKGE